MRTFAIICSAVIGASILCSPVVAQAKTAKECRAEWQANKAENQAKKITEKDYVKQCTAGATTAQPAPAPAKSTKKTEPKAPAPAAPKTETKMAPAPAAPAATSSSGATGANQYTTEAQAKARCGSGTVVWANLSSKIYHFSGHKDYGNTKNGAYMCERDATTEGMRAAKNEKHP
jgi:hypothetical protein